MTPQSDSEIIRDAREGDRRAFGMLVNRHQPRAMTLALRMLGNRQDAEEAVQDSFVRAFYALGTFEGRSSFPTWLYRIVYNVSATMLKKRGADVRVVEPANGSGIIERAVSPDDVPDVKVGEAQIRAIAVAALENLPLIYRAPLTLFLLDELGYDEIVEITGLNLGTVKARLSRGRVLLREAILSRVTEQEIML